MFKIPVFDGRHQLSAAERERLHGPESLPLKLSIHAFLKLVVPFWKTRESIFAWVLLGTIIAFTGGAVYLSTLFNSWRKDFWDAIQEYNLPGFVHYLWVFTVLAAIHVVTSVYNAYLRQCLVIRWRRWFTSRVMSDWLDDNTFYKLQLMDRKTENPDQRISEDLASYVTNTIRLILSTGTDLAMLITFGVVLWDLSNAVDMKLGDYELHLPDGYMLYLALVYAVGGTVLTFIIGKPLVRLNFRQQRFEADFRFSLIRVRENSESIALYHGEQVEGGILKNRFNNVVSNFVQLIRCEKRLGFFTFSYGQLAVIFPILIAAPMYFEKVISIVSIMQIISAFGVVQSSLSTLIDNFSSWASFKAVVDRLALYFDSMDYSTQVRGIEPGTAARFGVSDLTVSRPGGEELCTDLKFALDPGDRLLIRGPSGCGKSTLIRAVAGIWPYCRGEVDFPEGARRLFLSQRPYLPQGTLRAAACYPEAPVTDGRVEQYFEKVGLGKFIARLDEENIWDHILSLGEQQRVAVVRALLLRPQLLFLDEATSALDEANEARVYGLLAAELPGSVMVSVGHRTTLLKAHNRTLTASGLNWVFGAQAAAVS